MQKNTKKYISKNHVADILGISKRSLVRFEKDLLSSNFKFKKGFIPVDLLKDLPEFKMLDETLWNHEIKTTPVKNYKSIEIFAGAGGLAIGLDKAGFESILLNDFDKDSCDTLKRNRNWHVEHDDVTNLSFKKYKGEVDLLSGGFPCQAFSYAGNKREQVEKIVNNIDFDKITTIIEPFCGSCAISYYISTLYPGLKYILNDNNKHLREMFYLLKDDDKINLFENEYNDLLVDLTKDKYNELKKKMTLYIGF